MRCKHDIVTILILIDGFLQFRPRRIRNWLLESHNPYFNRWFSAITDKLFIAVHLTTSQSLF